MSTQLTVSSASVISEMKNIFGLNEMEQKTLKTQQSASSCFDIIPNVNKIQGKINPEAEVEGRNLHMASCLNNI